jgi:DNA-damage-inducible protein J
MIHVRVDEDLKTRASDTLEKMGLSLSDAVRLLLTRIAAEQAETVAAMQAGDRGEVTKASSVAEMIARLNAND